MMDLNTAIEVIESCTGFTDESTPAGEAWAVVLSYLYAGKTEADRAEAGE